MLFYAEWIMFLDPTHFPLGGDRELKAKSSIQEK